MSSMAVNWIRGSTATETANRAAYVAGVANFNDNGRKRMRKRSVAIVGYGAVGRGIHQLFPDAVIYDEPIGVGSRDEVNASEYAFVAVPTPRNPDGSCDTAIVEGVVSWIQSGTIILRSTVAVGTTDRLVQSTGKRLVFQPE